MNRTLVCTAVIAVVGLAGAASPAVAATKNKPVTKEYTATAGTPGGVASYATSTTCSDMVKASVFDVSFKAPYTGRLSAKQDKFQGDWDFAFVQDGGNAAESAQQLTDPIDRPEAIEGFKMKKGQQVTIRSCNFSGGPTAHVAYTFS